MTAAETELVAAPPVVRRARADAHPQPQPPPRHRSPPPWSSSAAPPAWPPPPPAPCPARRALPDQARHRAGQRRGSASATPAKGKALLDQAAHPPRRGPTRSRPQGSPDADLVAATARRPSAAPPTRAPRSCSPPTRPTATPPTSPPCATSPPTQMAEVADALRRRRPRDRRPAPARRRRHPRRHRPAGPRPVRHLRPGRRRSRRPAALSSGAGAATVDNLLARPVSQAQRRHRSAVRGGPDRAR